MPELPEVETIIRYLRPQVEGTKIADVWLSELGASHFNVEADEVGGRLQGAHLNSLDRYGKWMLFDLSSGPAIAHLRMSGRYEVSPEKSSHPHLRFAFRLNNNSFLNYIDQRRFGTFHFADSFEDYLNQRNLGPDALGPDFNPTVLYSALQKTSRPIYSALLDQKTVAGLGNIYVNEALHATKIHPLQPANTLSNKQTRELHQNILELLQLALQMKGTTLVDNLYQDPGGSSGEFYKLLKVYGKKNDPEIEVLKIGSRSVFVHKNTMLQT